MESADEFKCLTNRQLSEENRQLLKDASLPMSSSGRSEWQFEPCDTERLAHGDNAACNTAQYGALRVRLHLEKLRTCNFDAIQQHVGIVLRHRQDIYDAANYIVSLCPDMEELIDWSDIVYHDLSKLGKSEILAYANKFCDGGCQNTDYNSDWDVAVAHHRSVNMHHPEYYIDGDIKPNDGQVLSIIIDWMAAGKSYGSKSFPVVGAEWPFVTDNVESPDGRFHLLAQDIMPMIYILGFYKTKQSRTNKQVVA